MATISSSGHLSNYESTLTKPRLVLAASFKAPTCSLSVKVTFNNGPVLCYRAQQARLACALLSRRLFLKQKPFTGAPALHLHKPTRRSDAVCRQTAELKRSSSVLLASKRLTTFTFHLNVTESVAESDFDI